jgi:quercetin dioxygenase-like cupin family protein
VEVHNAATVEPTVEHGGLCNSYFMIPKESVRNETMGSYLEFVAEFDLAPGTQLEPHFHDTDEYYYILSGKALMQIGSEKRELGPGDLVHIPRNAPHAISSDDHEPFRGLAFAVSFQPEGATYTPTELPE